MKQKSPQPKPSQDAIVNRGVLSVVFERATERDRKILEEIVK